MATAGKLTADLTWADLQAVPGSGGVGSFEAEAKDLLREVQLKQAELRGDPGYFQAALGYINQASSALPGGPARSDNILAELRERDRHFCLELRRALKGAASWGAWSHVKVTEIQWVDAWDDALAAVAAAAVEGGGSPKGPPRAPELDPAAVVSSASGADSPRSGSPGSSPPASPRAPPPDPVMPSRNQIWTTCETQAAQHRRILSLKKSNEIYAVTK